MKENVKKKFQQKFLNEMIGKKLNRYCKSIHSGKQFIVAYLIAQHIAETYQTTKEMRREKIRKNIDLHPLAQ